MSLTTSATDLDLRRSIPHELSALGALEIGAEPVRVSLVCTSDQRIFALSWGRIGFDGVVGRAMASRAPGS